MISRASRVASVVVDTNVLLRAAVSPAGPAARLYASAKRGDFRLVLSPHLLREVRAGFFKPHFRSRYPVAPREIAIFLAELLVAGELVAGDFEVDLVPEDPEDNPIVASALEGDAAYVREADRPPGTRGSPAVSARLRRDSGHEAGAPRSVARRT